MSVHQYVIGNIDELHDEFLSLMKNVRTKLISLHFTAIAAIVGKH